MKTLRIVLGILAAFPLALLADKLIFPPTEYGEDTFKTFDFLILGIPILILNYWAWFSPERVF